MTKFKMAALAALASVFLVSCDSEPPLNKAYFERFGGNRKEKKLGFAVFANPGNKPYWCEIHATRPKRADDEPMDTMGHELAHCVFGQFHEQ